MNALTNILIVDDEEPVRELLVACLGSRYPVRAVPDAEAAIRELENRSFALVISDVCMSGMSGIDLCKWIAHKRPQTPVILMSGNLQVEHRDGIKECSAFEFMSKPFDLSRLRDIVTRALQQEAGA